MADSDEEFERKRRDRDKFKRERECSDNIELSESKRKHSSVSSGNSESIRQKHELSQLTRSNKRYKRSSQDFQSFPYLWPFEVPPNMDNVKQPGSNISPASIDNSLFLMSFKQFMNEQDDSIDELEAVSKYHEYKQNISAQFISSYFDEHKNEQWFQEKYHPYTSDQIKVQSNLSLLQRLVAFWFLFETGLFENFSLDVECESSVESIIDIALILMDFRKICDKTLSVSGIHRKIIEKINLFDPSDSINPDTTTSSSCAEEREKNQLQPQLKQPSIHDLILPEKCYPFSTSTISICGLPLSIQRERLETICKPFAKVIRIFLTDPTTHTTAFRNCFITFADNIDIHSLISHLQSNFLKEDFPEISICMDTNCMPRVKTSPGIFNALDVVISNISLLVKIVRTLDTKLDIFMNDSWIQDQADVSFITSQLKFFSSPGENPLLLSVPSDEEIAQIRSNLAAAEKAEEEEEGVIPSEVSFRKNMKLLKVLDNLIIYLRIVHSYDFYSNVIMDLEDLKPCRLSEMTIRGSTNNSATVKEVNKHINDFSNSINSFLDQHLQIPLDEMLSLGRRTEEECIEKFILENTKMIEVEKYLCPLSGKKFKGPEYVRKHIHNKHRDKIDEVKLEVQYFNRYLSDRNRPMPKMKCSSDVKSQKNPNKNESMLSLMGNQVFRSKDGIHTQNWPFHPNILLPHHGSSFPHGMEYSRFPGHSNFGSKRNQNRKIDDNRKPISYKDWDDPNLDN